MSSKASLARRRFKGCQTAVVSRQAKSSSCFTRLACHKCLRSCAALNASSCPILNTKSEPSAHGVTHFRLRQIYYICLLNTLQELFLQSIEACYNFSIKPVFRWHIHLWSFEPHSCARLHLTHKPFLDQPVSNWALAEAAK